MTRDRLDFLNPRGHDEHPTAKRHRDVYQEQLHSLWGALGIGIFLVLVMFAYAHSSDQHLPSATSGPPAKTCQTTQGVLP